MSDAGDELELLAIRFGRLRSLSKIFGSERRSMLGEEPAGVGWYSLGDEQVLRILRASGRPICRPRWCIETPVSTGMPVVPGLSDSTMDIAAAAVEVCRLLKGLHERGLGPPVPERIKHESTEALADELTRLTALLGKDDIVARFGQWNVTTPVKVLTFQDFKAMAEDLQRWATRAAESCRREREQSRDRTHNDDGSAFERFVRECLAPAYFEIHRSRASGTTNGPFIRFARQFFIEADVRVGCTAKLPSGKVPMASTITAAIKAPRGKKVAARKAIRERSREARGV